LQLQNQGKIPNYAQTEVEASSAGQGDNADMSMLDVNDLTNYVMQQNLRQNNAGTDTVDANIPMSQPSADLSRRGLPPREHNARLRLQQPSTTTARGSASATPQ